MEGEEAFVGGSHDQPWNTVDWEGSISPFRDAALVYAKLGYPVYPIHGIRDGRCTCGNTDDDHSHGKHPREMGGFHAATIDKKEIHRWGRRYEDANVAMNPALADMLVLDFDPRHGGHLTFQRLIEDHGDDWALSGPCAETGGGGIHLYFRHPGGYIKSRSGALDGMDIRADKSGVVLPPSLHIDGPRYRWAEGRALWDVPLPDLPSWALDIIMGSEPPREPNTAPCQSEFIPKGRRNDVLFQIARHGFGLGLGQEAVEELVSFANGSLTEEPLGQSELIALLRSAPNYASTPPVTPSAGLQLLSIDDLAERQAPEQLVEGVLAKGSLAVLVGEPGIGKSFLAIDIAAHVACGAPWQDRPVLQMPVVYIAGEGQAGLASRVSAWSHCYGASPRDLRVVPQAVDLTADGQVGALAELIVEQSAGVGLVVVDTLARCMGDGDENSAKDMGRLVAGCAKLIERTGAAVLLLHHPPKNGSSSYRGSSALMGAADTMLELRGGATDIRQLQCVKQKDLEEFPVIELQLGRANGSCVFTEPGASARMQGRLAMLDDTDRRIVEVIADLTSARNVLVSTSSIEQVSAVRRSTLQKRLTKLESKSIIGRDRGAGGVFLNPVILDELLSEKAA